MRPSAVRDWFKKIRITPYIFCKSHFLEDFKTKGRCFQDKLEPKIFLRSFFLDISRLVIVRHEAKKKHHIHTSSSLCDYYSELFTFSRAIKFLNTVTKPP